MDTTSPRSGQARDLAREGAALHAAYDANGNERMQRGAAAYCAIAAVLIVATMPLDHVRFPELASALLPIRLIGAALLATLFGVLQTGAGRRQAPLLGLLAASVAGGVIDALTFSTGGEGSPVTVSMNFVVLGVALLMPWPATWSALACGLVVGGYVISAIVAEGYALGPRFIETLLVLSATSALTVVTTGLRERRRRQTFVHEWALGLAHRDARDSAQRYRSVVETAGGAIILVSRRGVITEFNHEAERVLAWTRSEAIGRDYLELCFPEDGRAAAAADFARALRGEPTRGREARMLTRHGEERVLLCNASQLTDADGHAAGVVVCAQDISDRTRVEEALRESEARLRTVIADAPVVVFRLDRSRVITFVEGKGLARLDLSPADLIGRHVTEALVQLGRSEPSETDNVGRTLAGEEVTWVGTIGKATFECRLTPARDDDGRVTGVVGLAIDVTERTQAENARLELERRLLAAQKLESLGVLAAGIAHDFNNLLMSVLGNVSIALDELNAGARVRDRLERIATAARRGSDLSRQLLASAGKGGLMIERVDVNMVVAEVADLLGVSVGRGVTLRFALDPHLPEIEADPTQIRQVAMNLVLNACEAVGERGEVTVRTGTAVVSDADVSDVHRAPDFAPGPHLLVEVADTGCGMDAATMERIFDPFYSTKVTGRGLGLATVLGVVRGHGGALAVRSEPGRGTTFRILLPCREAAPRVAGDVMEAAAPSVPAPEGRTVLLVDDEEDVRTVTAHMLERLGCSVLVAGDGSEGVELFRTRAQTIDAVLMDLTLPRMNGERAFREMRTIRPDARVILMSGYNDEGAMRRLTETGLTAFLRKPFSIADLRSTIGKALGASPDAPTRRYAS